VRANQIDTGFIERELTALTKVSAAPGELEVAGAVAAILAAEAEAAAPDAHSPWQTFGWMPVGGRQRQFTFRGTQGPEHPVTLHYGKGPTTLSVGKREIALESTSAKNGEIDLTLEGVKSRIVAVLEGHELYLRTRNGRFELHWVDPFGGETEE